MNSSGGGESLQVAAPKGFGVCYRLQVGGCTDKGTRRFSTTDGTDEHGFLLNRGILRIRRKPDLTGGNEVNGEGVFMLAGLACISFISALTLIGSQSL